MSVKPWHERKFYIRDDEPWYPRRSSDRVQTMARYAAALLIALAAVLFVLRQAHAQSTERVTLTESTAVTLLRGTTTVQTLESWDVCIARAKELARASTATSGSVTYTCQTEKRKVVATYRAVCPALPAPETRTQTCPTGTVGTWTQTRSFVTAPAPTCSIAGSWQPASPPADACPLPDLAAPEVTLTSPDANVVAASWPAVAGATAYRLDACFVAGCTPRAMNQITGLSLRWPVNADVTVFRLSVCAMADTRTTCADVREVAVTQPAQVNGAPAISGTPATSAKVGTPYTFKPSASDPDGDALTFSVANKPAWAQFNTGTGELAGTPTAAGSTANVSISVSDGKGSANLPPFTLTVTQSTSGAVTLSWTPPTLLSDGKPLTDIAGYVIEYGTSTNNLGQRIEAKNPNISSYVVSNLAPGTYYFAVRAVRVEANAEGPRSNVASKTIQ